LSLLNKVYFKKNYASDLTITINKARQKMGNPAIFHPYEIKKDPHQQRGKNPKITKKSLPAL
jgi:hypothetical protein